MDFIFTFLIDYMINIDVFSFAHSTKHAHFSSNKVNTEITFTLKRCLYPDKPYVTITREKACILMRITLHH